MKPPTLSWNGIRCSLCAAWVTNLEMNITRSETCSWVQDGSKHWCSTTENLGLKNHFWSNTSHFTLFLIMIMIDLDLRIEQSFVEAGSLMKGRVDLAIRFRTEASSGIHLVLVGEEVTSIKCSESTSKGGAPDEPPKFDRAKSTIIQATIPVKCFSAGFVEAGRYNFPFEYQLPATLPSTMVCPGDDGGCEIQYRIVACLPKNSGEPVLSKPVSICVVAASTEKELRRVEIPLEQFPIKHCCLIDQGCVTLGWESDTTVGSPGSSIIIGIVGKNDSVVPISYLVASWDEVVTLQCNGKSKVFSRTLSSTEFYPTATLWEPQSQLSSSRRRYWNGDIESMMQNRLTLKLVLPKDARDSCQGSLITVQHTLSVKAVISEWCTDSPESCIMVTVQRQIPKGSSIVRRPSARKATVTFAATPTNLSQREREVRQCPVKAEAIVHEPDAGESQRDTGHDTPMANAKLVKNPDACALVTAKDAMTNTMPSSKREKTKDNELRRWSFGNRKKKAA